MKKDNLFRIQLNEKGVTLVEMIIVVIIIMILSGLSVASLMGIGLSSVTKVRDDAKNLQQFLSIARIRAMGIDTDRNGDGKEDKIVVAFDSSNKRYYAFIDMDDDGNMDAGEQPEDLRLPMPDTATIGGIRAKVVNLQDGVNFGASGVKRREASIHAMDRGDGGFIYYCREDSSSNVDSDGLHLAGGATRVRFTKRGTSTDGSVYLYLSTADETPVSYNYSISISPASKINLWEWAGINDPQTPSLTKAWKMVS